ncbi:MAG: L-aspartate oxidase [Alphaproteobacteria bacterium]|nr:L-aspartate oxidase [Alphaproteobacteria bacterium]
MDASSYDVVIVGSGLAGLYLALQLADRHRVLVLTKRELLSGNTRWAQGGIAAAWDEADDWNDHVQDTLVAGAGLCKREVVERVVSDAPERVRELMALGVSFDRREGRPDEFDLHIEGGHSMRRVLHAKDSTGAEIMRALIEQVRAHERIEVREQWMAVDVITERWLARRNGALPGPRDRACGLYALDLASGEVEAIGAKVVALCTGGAGKVYLYTSNPDEASGDGMAMAWRCGVRIANMEFVQFHPTCLYHPEARNFLISEALRGEGGKLRDRHGRRFMDRYDKRGELAPRDIVARAIDSELKRTGEECVFLDMTHLSREEIEHHFPSIHSRCLELGIDMAVQGIPVVPAAHYFCGGAMTDLSGETNVENLFVAGEASCTGLHGANRLASNSLLEAADYAWHAARAIDARLPGLDAPPALPPWDPGHAKDPDEAVVISHLWDEIRRFMWNYVGIVRTTRRLERARKRIELVQEEIRTYYWDFKLTGDLVELRNLAQVAQLVIECALRRLESRGLHTTLDHPETDDRFLYDTVLKKRY